MRYEVVRGDSKLDLEDEVNKKIQEGFSISGGLSVVIYNGSFRFYQAVVINQTEDVI